MFPRESTIRLCSLRSECSLYSNGQTITNSYFDLLFSRFLNLSKIKTDDREYRITIWEMINSDQF